MRVVLDTNILTSVLLGRDHAIGAIYQAWKQKRFVLLTCHQQVEELRVTLRKPKIANRITPHDFGKLMNDLRHVAVIVEPLPRVLRSPDPDDDFLLALAEAGRADFLVSGDKEGLLSLNKHKRTKILSARTFAASL